MRDPASRHAAIIDSELHFDAARGPHFAPLLETHAHPDRLSAAAWLQLQLGGTLAIGRDIVRVRKNYGTARADFPGGNARQLYRSIRRLLSLPEQTLSLSRLQGASLQARAQSVKALHAPVGPSCGSTPRKEK